MDYVIKSQFPKIIDVEGDLNNLPDINVEDFTIAEITSCLGSMKRKGQGHKVLTGGLWIFGCKRFTQILIYGDFELLFIYVKVFFSESWKIPDVVLMPKDGKYLSEVTSYIPICLLPVWGKIFDKLILTNLWSTSKKIVC
ncbi:hypothetical protein AVEN_191154-1 [Araneus ventricosus]|uniref:Uncharacterized protein n=1 Tax=Araneus ventricosus TaxID=182803 RepID=A0A4Y2AZT2_ARAVE|nr:hypothetical protein AVEN_191154-1 [Araneus ventricosus]